MFLHRTMLRVIGLSYVGWMLQNEGPSKNRLPFAHWRKRCQQYFRYEKEEIFKPLPTGVPTARVTQRFRGYSLV